MFRKSYLLVAMIISIALLTGCTSRQIKDTTGVNILLTDIPPEDKELKAQMNGEGRKIILAPVEYSAPANSEIASKVYDDLSQRLLKSGNTVVDRALAAKLKNELLAAEVSGQFRTSGPAVAEIALMTKITHLSYGSTFHKAHSWKSKSGEWKKRDAYCSFSGKAHLNLRAYKVPSMDLINTYEYEGSARTTVDTSRSSCPISNASLYNLFNKSLSKAIKNGSGETLNDLAPEAYVIERRDFEGGSESIFHVTIGKKSGATEDAVVKFYRKEKRITPITNETRIDKVLLGEGEIFAEGITDQGSYVYVDDEELIDELRIGDVVKLDHGKCDFDEYAVFGSCI
ncbi:hypothetical protein AB8E32_15000 [Marinomonas polaris]|uniref:hypothetical protein n=1 Tax=Marinomonas polaris TaxID=293552 RepID=UPI003514F6F3